MKAARHNSTLPNLYNVNAYAAIKILLCMSKGPRRPKHLVWFDIT
jgi:hypothetical protein